MNNILTVDYSFSLTDLITRAAFNLVDKSLMSEEYPGLEEGIINYEWKVFGFHQIKPSEAAKYILWEDRQNPWQLAQGPQLISWAILRPRDQFTKTIVGLGAPVGKGRYEGWLALTSVSRIRRLSRIKERIYYSDRIIFLACRPISKP
jgi:hypothetical protein